MNTAIGQGEVAVTPLQLANAYAAFANGGTRVAAAGSRLRIADQTGQVDPGPAARSRSATSTSRRPGATRCWPASRAWSPTRPAPPTPPSPASRSASIPIAGKTGTAQVQGKQATSVFTSFAPANNPQYVVDAFIEQAGYGADAAAPVVRRIYDGLSGQPVQPIAAVKSGVD